MSTTLHFQTETITPLVIAGAHPKSPNVLAEGLRPPSLRGAMRWWFRAMMGSIVGAHDNYKTLRNFEGQVFGATDQGSSIRLRTYPVEGVKPREAHLCMNDNTGNSRTGIPRANIRRPSLYPPSTFLLNMQSDQLTLPAGVGALWLSAMLGGVGNRSRRGFGSLALSPDTDTMQAIKRLDLDFSYPDKPLADIAQWLENGLKRVHGYFKSYVPSISSPPSAQFPVLSKAQAKLWFIKPQSGFWNSWSDAMDKLRDDIYRPYKTTKRLTEIGSAKPRLASPLIIQIKRVQQEKYFGVLLAFEHDTYFGKGWADFVNFLKTLSGYEYQEVTLL